MMTPFSYLLNLIQPHCTWTHSHRSSLTYPSTLRSHIYPFAHAVPPFRSTSSSPFSSLTSICSSKSPKDLFPPGKFSSPQGWAWVSSICAALPGMFPVMAFTTLCCRCLRLADLLGSDYKLFETGHMSITHMCMYTSPTLTFRNVITLSKWSCQYFGFWVPCILPLQWPCPLLFSSNSLIHPL